MESLIVGINVFIVAAYSAWLLRLPKRVQTDSDDSSVDEN
jgi:hypothetical protein